MTNKCLVPECKNTGGARGLCSNCYTSASLMVKRQLGSWKQFVKAGLAKEKHTLKPMHSKFYKAFTKNK